ncbi:MAG: putative nucleotidyltransferase, partial [Solirubrobacteraceae bacterium]|nr:putative nucleotidyltransferase [Solirubrobacteraceae bacterium]
MTGRPSLVAAARALVVDRATAEAAGAMSAAGVPVVLLKGPAIAQWLYDPCEQRGYSDADLLVA